MARWSSAAPDGRPSSQLPDWVVKRRCPPLKGTPRCRPSPPRTPDAPLKRPAEVCWNSQTPPVPSLGNKRPAEVCWFSQPRPVLFKSKGKRGVSARPGPFGENLGRTRKQPPPPKAAAAVARPTTRLWPPDGVPSRLFSSFIFYFSFMLYMFLFLPHSLVGGNIQEVILQEHLEKEDEILVSLAALKQIKDILKGSLRFNQSQLEAEENEQITIEDDHYCSNYQSKGASDSAEKLSVTKQVLLTVKQDVSDTSDNKHSDDYILVSKEEEGNVSSALQHVQTVPPCKETSTKNEAPCRSSLTFSDPLMGSMSASSSNLSSSPDDDSSNNSKDSDFTIVSPLEI
uniref:Uncharacterized protein n=1 Tax=Sphaerodactylus townsendi TaxID=933632 RepID=A0ACB8FV33_9SAUR